MSRVRSLLFPALVLGLLALAAFGVRQVIVGQEQSEPPLSLSDQEVRQIVEASNARSREAIEAFMATDGDPCSLPLLEASAIVSNPYVDLPALINDIDLIVIGEPTANVIEAAAPAAGGSRMLTTVQPDQTLMATAPVEGITVDSGQAVRLEGSRLARVAIADPDLCRPGQVLLFLKQTGLPNVYAYPALAWARIDGDAVETATYNELFQDYASAEALLTAVRQIGQEQQAQGLPKGLLLCRDRWSPLEVCPGDTFNPYQAFRLDTVSEAHVVTTDPGPSPLTLGRTDLEPGGPQLSALLSALDVEVVLEPAGLTPDDLIHLDVVTAEAANGRTSFSFRYSPSSSIVQMQPFNGQFPAPAAFQQAMAPFLATP